MIHSTTFPAASSVPTQQAHQVRHVEMIDALNLQQVRNRLNTRTAIPDWMALESVHTNEFHSQLIALRSDGVEVHLKLHSPCSTVWIITETVLTTGQRNIYVAKTAS